MFGLILRDLMALRKRLWLAVAYCLFGPMALRLLGQPALMVVVVAAEYTMILTALEYEGKYGVDATMASLPVTREQLVIARYLEIPLITAAAMLCCLLVTGACPWLRGNLPSGWIVPVTAFLMVAIVNGLNIPIIHRIGYLKARVYSTVILLTGTVLPAYILGFNLIDDPRFSAWIDDASGMTAAWMAAAAVVILTVSCMFSIRMYRKRQF